VSPDDLRQRIEYFKDLGVKELYRRESVASVAPAAESPVPVAAALPVTVELPSLAPVGDTLVQIGQDIGECTRCGLHKGRNKIVFGDGNPQAQLVFVGEGPGADEDTQGIPFVGRAGQLLTQMIEGRRRRKAFS